MQRHRFYATSSQFTSSTVTLDHNESHHLVRVLRLSKGDHVFVFDGIGHEWECEIARVAKHEAELTLLRRLGDVVESPLRLTLAQALVKGDKFDWIVQKTTELGVTRIVPLVTENSDIRKAEERAESKLQRWRRISLEAIKQSGRRRLVEISEPIKFEEFRDTETAGLFFSERGGRSLREVAAEILRRDKNQLPDVGQDGILSHDRARVETGKLIFYAPLAPDRLNLFVASEGGWSEAEIKKAEEHGLVPVTLGSRILRTETAAITAVALAQHLFGDLR